MKHKVLNLKTKSVIGVLIGFAVNESGIRYAIVRPLSRAMDMIIEINASFNSNYEVRP